MNLHETLECTPQPSACSTGAKRDSRLNVQQKTDLKRNLYSALNSSSESLGILSLEDMKPTKENSMITSDYLSQSSSQYLNSMQERLKATEKTRALLNKLASRSHSNLQNFQLFESTVNESDLLNGSNIVSDKDVSTVNESDLLRESSLSFISRASSKVASNDHTKPVRSSENLSQYIEELKKRFEQSTTASFSEVLEQSGSSSFISGADAKQLFDADEKAWKQEYASIPNMSQGSLSQISTSSAFDDKVSMGEFFRAKSDNISIFDKHSPIKHNPVPLVNSTTIDDEFDRKSIGSSMSILSLTDIKNMISTDSTPKKVVERLLKPQAENRRKESLKSDLFVSRASLASPKLSNSKYAKQYASSNDIHTESPSPGKIYTTKSLNHINNKENMPQHLTVEEKNRTLTSIRSTSSMDSIPDVIAKLASTKTELVWGCVKEGRTVVQDVTIRNKNNRRVKYMVQTSNPNFKLINIDMQAGKGYIYLHALETRQIQVSLTPTTAGPQVGQLYFTPVFRREEQTANRQQIALYGYGGHVNIDIKGQTRDLCGKLWVSLGYLDGRQVLSTDFVVRNTGSIDGFVAFTVHSKSLCAFEDIDLSPAKVVVQSGTQRTIQVKFRPSKNDLHQLSSQLATKSMKAAEIAVINMVSGADINRQRIMKLQKKIAVDFDITVQEARVQQLCGTFEGAMPTEETRHFRENAKSMKTLMQCLESTEMSLLVDRDMDATLMPEIDDSSMIFKTLVGNLHDSTLSDCHIDNSDSYIQYFNVELAKIILTPPTKCSDYILLNSSYHRVASFKITAQPAGVLRIDPSFADVAPGEIAKVKVSCDAKSKATQRQDIKVMIEVEDDVLIVVVSVLHL